MRKLLNWVFCGFAVIVVTVGASAQAAQQVSGDSMSCSISASLGKVVCAEAPSVQPPQAPITASAGPGTPEPGVSDVQKLQAEARSISKSASDALKSLQGQDPQSSEDTGAAEAVILQRVKQAADNLIAAAPDVSDPVDAYGLQNEGDFCQQAADFRDHRLFQLWDGQQKKYAALTVGSSDLLGYRTKLLSDGWWAESTGAQVAIEVKGFADLVNDTVGLFAPEKTLLAGAIHHAPEIARAVTGIGVLVTYAKENAQAAASESAKELGARYFGQIGAGTKLLLDVADYAKNKQDAQQYRDTVKMQVRMIDDTLRRLDAQRKAAVANMDGYQDIVEAIDMVCAKKAPEQQQMLANTTPVQDAPPKKSRFENALQGFNLALGLLNQYSAAHPGGRAAAVSSGYSSTYQSPVVTGPAAVSSQNGCDGHVIAAGQHACR